MCADLRIPLFELGQQFVTDAVACEREFAVRRIFAPRLADGIQVRLDFGAGGSKQWAYRSRGFVFWTNSCETIRPRAAQELGENRLGLIVECVRSGNCVEQLFGQEGAKPCIAQSPRGLFNRFCWLAGCGIGTGFGCGIDAGFMKWDLEPRCQLTAKLEIAIGFFAAQAVVQVRRMQHQPQFPAALSQCAKQSYGIGPSRQAYGNTHPRLEKRDVERERNSRLACIRSGHERMIKQGSGVGLQGSGVGLEGSGVGLQVSGVRFQLTAGLYSRDIRNIEAGSGIAAPILSDMLTTRIATINDSLLITEHRSAMFAEVGLGSGDVLATMSQSFCPWVERMMAACKYVGWIVEEDGQPVASAGFFELEWPPHPFDPTGEGRGYLLNFWVEPSHRRKGLAKELVKLAVAESRRRGFTVTTLHASDAGRLVYETLGFRRTSEMWLVDEAAAKLEIPM